MIGIILLLLVSVLTCAGQICQKQAAHSWQSVTTQRLQLTLRWLVLAAIFLAAGMLLWLSVLQHLPLSLAYPMLSLNFVLVTFAACWFFQEQITLRHWAGVISILLGILLMSLGS